MSRKPKIDRDVLMEQYLTAAEEAANIERLGNYQKASGLWQAAKKLALTEKQANWCQTRAEYCSRWQGKRERVL